MTARVSRWIFIGIFAALLLVPHAQKQFRLWDDSKLALIGIRKRTSEMPKITVRSWFDGSFAKSTDSWAREHLGLHSFFVRLMRTIRYELAGQVVAPPPAKTDVVVGKAPFLFENLYVIDAIRRPGFAEPAMREYLKSIVAGRDYLRSRGKALVFVLAPNKALLRPDMLPRHYRGKVADEHTDYPLFLHMLQENDITCVDIMRFSREVGKTDEYKLFEAPLSAHWSFYAAWRSWQQTIPAINEQKLLPPIPVPETDHCEFSSPIGMDRELRPQLNLLFMGGQPELTAAYPVPAPLPSPSPTPLVGLVVGDSYGFGLCDAIMRAPLFSRLFYWYYCRTLYDFKSPCFDASRSRTFGPWMSNIVEGYHPPKMGNRYIVDEADVVVVVMTTFNIDKRAWNFFGLLEEMAKEDAVLARIRGRSRP